MKTTKRKAAADLAPPVDQALTELTRRSARIVVSLVLRLIAVAVLIAVLVHQVPGLERGRALLDVAGAALIFWPFFTSLGRNYAWRIALGRSYARERRWADAERTLMPFLHPRIRLLFDATGEGIYWLAVSFHAQGRREEAKRLFAALAGERRGRWSEEAARMETSETARYAEGIKP